MAERGAMGGWTTDGGKVPLSGRRPPGRFAMQRKRTPTPSKLTLASRVLAERRAVLARLAILDLDRPPRRPGAMGGDNTPTSEAMEAVQESVANDIALASRGVLLARLRALNEAEKKIREGTYGRCEVCGHPIPPARLAAMPEATQCVPCAERTTSSVPPP